VLLLSRPNNSTETNLDGNNTTDQKLTSKTQNGTNLKAALAGGTAMDIEGQATKKDELSKIITNLPRPGVNHMDDNLSSTTVLVEDTTMKSTSSTAHKAKTTTTQKSTVMPKTESTHSELDTGVSATTVTNIETSPSHAPKVKSAGPARGVVRQETLPTDVVRRNATFVQKGKPVVNVTSRVSGNKANKTVGVTSTNLVNKKSVTKPTTKSSKVNRPQVLGATKVAGGSDTELITVATEGPAVNASAATTETPSSTAGGTFTEFQETKKSKLALMVSGLHQKKKPAKQQPVRTTEQATPGGTTTQWTSIDLRTNPNLEPEENFTWGALLTTLKPLAEHHRLQIICPEADNAIPNQPTFNEIQEKENRAWVLGLRRAKTENKPKTMGLERQGPFHPLKRLAQPAPDLEVIAGFLKRNFFVCFLNKTWI
jgi:hypothetical protein